MNARMGSPETGRALAPTRRMAYRKRMPRKFVDLSIYLENEVLSDPPAFAPKIQYLRHDTTRPTTSPPAAAWATTPPCTCSSAVCA